MLKKLKGFFLSFAQHSWGKIGEKSSYQTQLNLAKVGAVLCGASPHASSIGYLKHCLRLLYLEILSCQMETLSASLIFRFLLFFLLLSQAVPGERGLG